MKILKASLFLSVVATLAITTASFTSNSSGTSAFRLKEAQAVEAVDCDCALLGGNDKCLANNYGASCAPEGTNDCQSYNKNCQDEQVPPGSLQ